MEEKPEQMTDEEIFTTFRQDHKLGEFCYIQLSAQNDDSCPYYVKAKPNDTSAEINNGWPRTTDGDRGTGCVNDNDEHCGFRDIIAYDYLSETERDSMCTANAVSNAAAQLRHAWHHGMCGTTLKNVPKIAEEWEDEIVQSDMDAIYSEERTFRYTLIGAFLCLVVAICTVTLSRKLRSERPTKYRRLYRNKVNDERIANRKGKSFLHSFSITDKSSSTFE